MNKLVYLLAVLAALVTSVPWAATASNNYCSTDSGATWVPCPPVSGTGAASQPVKTTPNATAATTTTVLAGADATVSAADATLAERHCSNNGSVTAYYAFGHAATSSGDHPLTVGATLVEDRYSGAIHAYGTGSFACTKVTP